MADSGKRDARVVALVVAAGRGERLGAQRPKQYLTLGASSVLRRTVDLFVAHPCVSACRVVIAQDAGDAYRAALGTIADDLEPPVTGGASRQDSVRNGLEALAAAAPDIVLIHDAARPLCPPAVIDRVLDALAGGAGAIPALPVAETVKRIGADGTIEGTVPREPLVAAQTPQGFRFADILAAHQRALAEGWTDLTDDASVAERAGVPVRIVAGAPANLKITTPHDLALAAHLLEEAAMPTPIPVTGFGYDVHALIPGEGIVLGGITIPHDHRLEGHSDADVVLHAITDALLGAIADGDIGQHFPPSDPRWRGAASDIFLKEAVKRVTARGGSIANIDVTLICEAPKIGPHRDAMRISIAGIVGLPPGRVSVKATTSERLGFTGRREGIVAQAVATVLLAPEGPAR